MIHNIEIIRPKLNGQATTVIIDGKRFSSLNEMRCYYRISESQITKYKKEMNVSLEKVLDFLICKKEKAQEERNLRRINEEERYNKNLATRRFAYNSISYESFSSAIKQLNENGYFLSSKNVYALAKKKNITKQEAIDLILERRKLSGREYIYRY